MSYTIRNIRPSVLYIPDAALRLESGQAAVVTTLSPQMGELVALRAIEVVANDLPRIAPAVASTVPDAPPPPAESPVTKRGGRAAATPSSEPEASHDDQ
ncbi:MAG TPA: hypothetical protein PK794_13665 [Armatimonadota bacterium]|nr:hypothetical protein [Armatimonadota bacterium]